MKTKVITLVAFGALILSPAFGAPRKMNSSDRDKRASSPALPVMKNISREQSEARKLVAALTATQRSKMLTLLNEGTAEQLTDIKGISQVRAAAIEKGRPFESIDAVILVKGIGKGTFSEIITRARSLTTRAKKAAPSSASSSKTRKKRP